MTRKLWRSVQLVSILTFFDMQQALAATYYNNQPQPVSPPPGYQPSPWGYGYGPYGMSPWQYLHMHMPPMDPSYSHGPPPPPMAMGPTPHGMGAPHGMAASRIAAAPPPPPAAPTELQDPNLAESLGWDLSLLSTLGVESNKSKHSSDRIHDGIIRSPAHDGVKFPVVWQSKEAYSPLSHRSAWVSASVPTWARDPSIPRPLGFVTLACGTRISIRLYHLVLEHYQKEGWKDVTLTSGAHIKCSSFEEFEKDVESLGPNEGLMRLSPHVMVPARTYCAVVRSVKDPKASLETSGGTHSSLTEFGTKKEFANWHNLLYPSPPTERDMFSSITPAKSIKVSTNRIKDGLKKPDDKVN